MKSLLLIAVASVFSLNAMAQRFELGINGGMSTTTRPEGALYQGEHNEWTPAGSLSFHYNFHERWQAGLSIGVTSWKRTGQWPLTGAMEDSLGTEEISFTMAKSAVTFAFQLNHVIPFYQDYEDFVKQQIYFGVAAGPVIVANDGEVTTSRVNPNTPFEYSYTSGFNFQPGYGFMVGAQVGYTYYLGEHFGINVDIAPRIAWVETVDPRLGEANNQYSVMYFPTTIGLRYRFGY